MGEGLLSPGHLVIVLVIALLVLGPKRLPEFGRSLGSGIRGFKEAITGDHDKEETTGSLPASHSEPAADRSEQSP